MTNVTVETCPLGRRRFAGARLLGAVCEPAHLKCAECAPRRLARSPRRFLERSHGLAEIVERGGGVLGERICVTPHHPEREITAPR